jgi:Mn-containing catalase
MFHHVKELQFNARVSGPDPRFATLETIQPNFPPGVLQGDPRYTHVYYNMSNGRTVRGPWNEGQGPWGPGQSWEFVADPLQQVLQKQQNSW